MPDELMRGFLEQTIECVDAFSDALNYILQHYDVRTSEQKEFGSCNGAGSKSADCHRVCAQRSPFCCQCFCNRYASFSGETGVGNRPVS